MKKGRWLFLLMGILVLFIGCGKKEEEGKDTKEATQVEEKSTASTEKKVLRFNLGVEPKSIEPAVNSAIDGGHMINNLYEGLVRLRDGKITPGIAKSWEISEDGKTYTFHLRDSKWSDGKPVTAQDFKYAWERAADPSFGSEYAHQTFYIKGAKDFYEGKGKKEDIGIKVIDDKTLEVELVGPTTYFLDIVSRHNYMPVRKDVVEEYGENWSRDPKTSVTNGPFLLKEYNIGKNLLLAKNPYYWNAENVKIDEIDVEMIVDGSTALTAYRNGEIDVFTNIPVQEIPKLMREDSTFYIEPKMGTYYFIFNVQKAPFDDVNVRKAFNLAIDRKKITEGIAKSGEIPATGFVPNVLTDSQGKNFRETSGSFGVEVDGGNVEEAKKYLAEAGYPNGEGFPKVTLIYNTNEKHKAVCEAVQEMWKKNLGIEVELQNQEWAVFQDTRHQGNFDIARGGWIGDYLDPYAMLDLFTSYSGNNDAQWKWQEDPEKLAANKEYDDLAAKALVTSGAERDEALYKMEKILMDNMIIAPLYYYTGPVMASDRVKGWDVTLLGHFYFGDAEIVE